MAFVLIQHLDPTHSSLLSQSLTRATKMKVQEIKNGMKIRPNEVFVIPPGKNISVDIDKLTGALLEMIEQTLFYSNALHEREGSHVRG